MGYRGVLLAGLVIRFISLGVLLCPRLLADYGTVSCHQDYLILPPCPSDSAYPHVANGFPLVIPPSLLAA